jgi:hypothetical protein
MSGRALARDEPLEREPRRDRLLRYCAVTGADAVGLGTPCGNEGGLLRIGS